MIKRIHNAKIRFRIVVAAFFCSVLFFLFTTPLVSWFESLVSPPPEAHNFSIEQDGDKLTLTWDTVDVIDIEKYQIIAKDSVVVEIDNEVSEYVYSVDEYPITVGIRSVDLFGQKSAQLSSTVLAPTEENIVNIIEIEEGEGSNSSYSIAIFVKSTVLALIILIFTIYIFEFNIKDFKAKTLVIYPAVVTFPYLLFSLSFLSSEGVEFNKFVLSGVFSVIFYLIMYFVLLTVNILNISINIKIPLEQAGKASQFMFSLLSSYLVLILFFGVDYNFFEKIAWILPFISYLSFSSILMLSGVTKLQAAIRSLGITLTITFSIFVLSIWPINYVYAILAIAIFFYILLSVSLEEVKSTFSKYAWLEYSVLLALVTFLLIINSYWGINGSLM